MDATPLNQQPQVQPGQPQVVFVAGQQPQQQQQQPQQQVQVVYTQPVAGQASPLPPGHTGIVGFEYSYGGYTPNHTWRVRIRASSARNRSRLRRTIRR